MESNSKKGKAYRIIIYVLIAVSILFIFYKTLWRNTYGISEIRLNPVWKLIIAFKYRVHALDDVFNVLLFVPYGFSAYLIVKKKRSTVLFGFLLSLFVESMQYILQIGWFETEDILMNIIGAFLGSLISWLFIRLYLYVRKRMK